MLTVSFPNKRLLHLNGLSGDLEYLWNVWVWHLKIYVNNVT